MNRTARTLVLAAPLATVAIMAGAVSAQALPPAGPGGFTIPAEVDPEPHPLPLPQGPDAIVLPEPGPVDPEPNPDLPKGPGGFTLPEPGPVVNPDLPEGPGDITSPEPCPTHGVDCTPDEEPEPTDDGSTDDGSTTEDTTPAAETDPKREIPTPTRIDAGQASDDAGLDLAWLLAGGAAVAALGAAGVGYRYLERRA